MVTVQEQPAACPRIASSLLTLSHLITGPLPPAYDFSSLTI